MIAPVVEIEVRVGDHLNHSQVADESRDLRIRCAVFRAFENLQFHDLSPVSFIIAKEGELASI